MKVSNGSCIRRLSIRALLANRTRNIVAVLAIALTAVLFTSLFTIAISINEGIQQNNFRQAGGCSHGTFKYLTEEQCAELQGDSLIQAYGIRRFLGMPIEIPFNKSHVEIGYSDANEAHWAYCDPVEGRLPQEGTNEAATDTHVLELLGVEPKIGAEFTVTFDVDGHETTQTFTLCGWWEYDEAIVANHILVPESRVDAVLAEVGVTPPGNDGMTGSWNLDVMLKHGARSIADDMEKILTNHGYQSQTAGDNYIAIGVNWGYTGAQLSDKLDPTVVAIIVGMLALILLTGGGHPFLRSSENHRHHTPATAANHPNPSPAAFPDRHSHRFVAGLAAGWCAHPHHYCTARWRHYGGFGQSAPICGCRGICPDNSADFLSPSRQSGRQGFPGRSGALYRRQGFKAEEKTKRQGRFSLVHGLGQSRPQPGQDLSHGTVPDPCSGVAGLYRHLYSRL